MQIGLPKDFAVNNAGQKWRTPFLIGRKFESEGAIDFHVRDSLTGVNSTAKGIDNSRRVNPAS